MLDKPVRAGQRADIKVVVRTADETVPTGEIRVRVRGAKNLTRTLDADQAGVLRLKLPKLAVGTHRVKVRYLGSSDVESSAAKTRKVRVKRAKAGKSATSSPRGGWSAVDS
ncbi:hypothetical protein NOK12_11020 [Nocardioides sp. OK12]|uniref:Ig-like domain-containing protein n=1 Tax=Nocardioides sp. OK12 TaxID=2758661 RepID=UPI0021C323BB|nr:Ig-like domain-containing protein [Nocardioides sp. OK12]GHJ58584.1 hypothetical protein NOK12_11020 [Nocardioides sp. OK12]